jgi:hypothetical protein
LDRLVTLNDGVLKRLLVISPHPATTREAIRIFQNQEILIPDFVLCFAGDDEEAIRLAGFRSFNWASVSVKDNTNNKASFIKRCLKSFLDNTWLGVFLQKRDFLSIFYRMFERKFNENVSRISALIDHNSYQAIFIFNDRSAKIEAAAIFAGDKRNIPVYGLGFGHSADVKSCVTLRQSLIYRSQGLISDGVLSEYKGVNYRFYRPFEAKVLYMKGVLSSNPWVLGAGRVQKFLISSNRERNRLVRNGGSSLAYEVVGCYAFDKLMELAPSKKKLKEKLLTNFELDYQSDVIVLALPHYSEHGYLSYSDAQNLLKLLVMELSKTGLAIFVSLHPKMKSRDYTWVNSIGNARLIYQDLADFIICADVFVTSYSSTIEWAFRCNIPVLNVDLIGHHSNEDFFEEFKFLTIEHISDTLMAIDSLRKDQIYRNDKVNMFYTGSHETTVEKIVKLLDHIE